MSNTVVVCHCSYPGSASPKPG